MNIDDLVEFNQKVLGQVWALQNPASFQPGMKQETFNFELRGSSKNYLFVPLKLSNQPNGSPLSYQIDQETVHAFADRNLGERTLKRLNENGLVDDAMHKDAVFFSRFDPQLCF